VQQVAAPPAGSSSDATAGSQEKLTAPLPSLAPLVKEVRPAVVNIYTTQTVRARRAPRRGMNQDDPMQDFFDRFFSGRGAPESDQKRQSLGSGFLIGNGMALTNNHVIDGADEIKVKLADGRTFDAKVVGRDPSTDVALLQLSGDAASTTQSVKLGDSDSAEVGDYVVAIGNPFGLSLTVTSGIVSAKDRVIGAGPYDDFIQTDASINPGNSGGPLFNLRGEVVGINTAIVAQGQGIGFAVPINLVKELVPQLRERGKVSRGWLGVGIQEITPELAKTFGLENKKGALISQVFPSGPAAKGGIQSGDVVTELNGKAIDSQSALTRAVASVPPGSKVKLKYLRDGKEQTTEVTVTERDEERIATGDFEREGDSEASGSIVGLKVAPITPEIAQRIGVNQGEGLLVSDVGSGSAAEAAGVQPNDVLLELQRRPMTGIDAFRKVSKGVKSGDTVLFRVRRGGSALYLAARAPQKK
jgi:serine protease Do